MRFFLISLFLLSDLCAQQPFLPTGTYDNAIPVPSSALGYEIGERFTDFRNLERYLEKLSATSDRVRLIQYGETYERRPLRVLVISSPQNLSRLEEIKSSNRLLTDPRRLGNQKENILRSLPAIVWLSYGVHGNESSSPEAALLTAYQLSAGTDKSTQEILQNLVVLLDPVVNPDGRERYVQWIHSALGSRPNANPHAMEHSEPWPGGRTNHYLFDLNRDWAWMTQKETEARIRLYREWMPHVHVDFHEMGHGSTYFFFPAAAPLHTEFPPEVKKWGQIYGKGNAEALDRFGIPYYTAESFDLFYPGYGDSWPTFNGAIGMTYEQAGGGIASVAVKRPDGQVLTLKDRVRNHFLTGMATLETTVKHKKERLQDFAGFWESGLKTSGRVKGFVVREQPDPNRAARMISVLLKQGIEVHQLEEATGLETQRFFSRRSQREQFPKGTYFISLQQPQSRLAKALLEPETAMRDTFFYDISAWSLPVAYGLTAYTSFDALPPRAKAVSAVPAIAGDVKGGKASFAYIIPWERNDAIKAVWSLLGEGYRLSVATRSFETLGRSFSPGTIVAFVSANRDSLHESVSRTAVAHGIEIFAVHSGLTDKGINLGSNYVRPVRKPEIAIATDAPVNPNDFGELWYLLDQDLRIPFTAIRTRDLGSVPFSKYDVLILPDAGDYRSILDSARVGKLRQWIEEGGVLIGMEGGARFMTRNRSGLTPAFMENEKKEEEKTKEEKDREKARKEEAKLQSLFEKEESERLQRIPGTIFRALIDTTHPIGFGYGRETYVFKSDSPPLQLSESGHTVVRFSSDTMSISGYATPERARKVANSAFLLDFRSGRGRAVLFAENVTFRMFWIGHQKLLLNAMLFLPPPE